jgi:hypothetical protein
MKIEYDVWEYNRYQQLGIQDISKIGGLLLGLAQYIFFAMVGPTST